MLRKGGIHSRRFSRYVPDMDPTVERPSVYEQHRQAPLTKQVGRYEQLGMSPAWP